MLFGSKSQLNKLDIDSISISGNDIPLSNSCRNLGVIFSSQISMLNHSKCEFMLFGSKSQLNKLDIDSISISGNDIPLSNSCRNLGVIFSSQISMSKQTTSICKSVHYQLRNIGFIRKYLTCSATEKLVHSLISSRLDFGNGLLCNHGCRSRGWGGGGIYPPPHPRDRHPWLQSRPLPKSRREEMSEWTSFSVAEQVF